MSPRLLSRWARLLVGLYPPGFRAGAGPDLERLLSDAARDAGSTGELRLLGFLFRNTLASLKDALTEWTVSTSETVRIWLATDLLRATRVLRRHPTFAATAALTFGVGVGAVGAVAALTAHLVLTPPAGIGDPRGVVTLSFAVPDRPQAAISGPAAEGLRQAATSFEGFATYRPFSIRARVPGARPTDIHASAIYGDYFDVLRVEATAGRLLHASETGTEADAYAIVLSERLAVELFGRPMAAVGAELIAGTERLRVVGVASAGFQGTDRSWPVDAWVPTSAIWALGGMARERIWSSSARTINTVLLRPRPRISLAEAEAELSGLLGAMSIGDPERAGYLGEMRPTLHPGPTRPQERTRPWGTLAILAAGSGLLVLLTCGNVASLLFARGLQCRDDAAVARALGASVPAILRQRVAETLVLAAVGVSIGCLIAWGVTWVFRGQSIFGLPELGGMEGRPWALATAAAVVACTAMLAGTLPALLPVRVDPTRPLRLRATADRRFGRAPALLSAMQVALAIALLIPAIQAVRTVRALEASELGIEPAGVHALTLLLGEELARDDAVRRRALYGRILESVDALPSINGTALNSSQGPYVTAPRFQIADPTNAGVDPTVAQVNWVTPGWFELFGAELIAGRGFLPQDETGGPLKAVLTAALADRLFGGTDVIGRMVEVGTGSPERAEIVGVSADVRLWQLGGPPDDAFFLSRPPSGLVNPVTVLFRPASADAEILVKVRRALESVLPNVPVPHPVPLSDHIAQRVAEHRIVARALAVFAGMALLVSATGIYGVLSLLLTERRQELGIRIALGSGPRRLTRLVIGSALRILGLGLAAGLVVAVALSQALQSRLEAVAPLDLSTSVLAAALLFGVIALACWVPARAAAATEPARSLNLN